MNSDFINIVIFGSEAPCPGCLHAPSSRETKEWLEAAVSRKFPDLPLRVRYVDIEEPPENDEERRFCEQILNGDYFYPLVVINGKVVGEGNPRLKPLFREIEKAI